MKNLVLVSGGRACMPFGNWHATFHSGKPVYCTGVPLLLLYLKVLINRNERKSLMPSVKSKEASCKQATTFRIATRVVSKWPTRVPNSVD